MSPRWTAEARKSARRPGKSDALDALAVARLVLGEAATLPVVGAEDETAVLDLLTTERDAAVAEGTRLRNQLHALLLHLDPEYRAHLPALDTKAGLAAVEGYTTASPRRLDQERAAAVRRLAQRLRLAVDQAAALAKQIGAQVQTSCVALTRLCGVNLLTAGALAGILGPGRRFRTEAQLAAYAGVAPLEASSRRAGPPPPQPGRQPAPERPAVPHRPDPVAVVAGGAGLPRAADGRGQAPPGGAAGPQAPPGARRLAPVAGVPRPAARPARAPAAVAA